MSRLVVLWTLVVFASTAKAVDLPWGDRVDLSAPGQLAFDPHVVVSDDGTRVTAVWLRNDGTDEIVQSRSALVSGATANWGEVHDLSTAGYSADLPRISLSSDGTRATAVWVRFQGTGYVTESASAMIDGNSATWGDVTSLSSSVRTSYSPHVALSSDGSRAIATWKGWDGDKYIIQGKTSSISGNVASWGPSQQLSADHRETRSAHDPRVALSADGSSTIAVWRQWNGDNDIIRSRSATISADLGDWGAVTDLSAPGQSSGDARIAMSADGASVSVVWSRNNGTAWIAQGVTGTVNGNTATWGEVADLSERGQSVVAPQVVLSTDGTRATAAWYRSNGNDAIVQSRSASIDGRDAAWGEIDDLSLPGESAYDPRIAASSDGKTLSVVWARFDGSSDVIQNRTAIIAEDTVAWGPITNLSTSGGDAAFPEIALSSGGTTATAIWYRDDGFDTIVQGVATIAPTEPTDRLRGLNTILMLLLNE